MSLGSNVGDRAENIGLAISEIENFVFISKALCSRIVESSAVLPENAPETWDLPFLNCCISGRSKMYPMEILHKIKEIEQKIGRIDRGRWGPREIDIDIIKYGSMYYISQTLRIPHVEMKNRDFVLNPMQEVVRKNFIHFV